SAQACNGRGCWRISMNTIGVLLLAAATAGDGYGYSKPWVGMKRLLHPHVTANGPAPAGGMIMQTGGGMGCMYGHAGCMGGSSCPGGGGAGGMMGGMGAGAASG